MRAAAEQSDVEAMLNPDQRRPSDAQPPDLSEIWGQHAPQGSGGFGGGRAGGPERDADKLQREEIERARFDRELCVRGRLDDGRARPPAADSHELDVEEQGVKERILRVEDRISTILQQPFGADGLGRKRVWRVRPTQRIWADAMGGDKRTTEVIKDGATAAAMGAAMALRGTAQAVSTGASRVVSWSYKPALWSAAELASDSVSVAARGAYTAATAVVGGLQC